MEFAQQILGTGAVSLKRMPLSGPSEACCAAGGADKVQVSKWMYFHRVLLILMKFSSHMNSL